MENPNPMKRFQQTQEPEEVSLPSGAGLSDTSSSGLISNESCRPTARASKLMASRVVFWPLSTLLTYVCPSLARVATCSCVQPNSCRAFSRASPNWRASRSVICRAWTWTDAARFFCGLSGKGRPDLLISSVLADLLLRVETASGMPLDRVRARMTGAISEPSAPLASLVRVNPARIDIAMNLQAFPHPQSLARRPAIPANDEFPRFRRPIGDSYQSLIGVYCRFIVDNPAGAWRFIVPSLVLHWRFIVTALQFHRGQSRWPEFPAASGKSGLAG